MFEEGVNWPGVRSPQGGRKAFIDSWTIYMLLQAGGSILEIFGILKTSDYTQVWNVTIESDTDNYLVPCTAHPTWMSGDFMRKERWDASHPIGIGTRTFAHWPFYSLWHSTKCPPPNEGDSWKRT